MRLIVTLLFFPFAALPLMAQDTTYTSERRLDLNRANLAQIEYLPIPLEVAHNIYERLTYQGPFESVYELNQIEGMDQETFLRIKPLLIIRPVEVDVEQKRLEDNYYKIERWASTNEGTTENLVDEWYDLLVNPININRANYFDLINLPSVSPIDAAAIVRHLRTQDQIRSRSDLRSVSGLGSFAFNSIDDFVLYEDPTERNQLRGNYTWVFKNIPFVSGSSDNADDIKQLVEKDTPWSSYHKARLTYGRHYRMGFSAERKLGQNFYNYKLYYSLEDHKAGPIHVDKVILGNYLASFGQGVVMENTDFFSSRKSGYGFTRRPNGVFGDISRTNEFALRGVATEMSVGGLRWQTFASYNTRDAVVNDDGSFSTLIVMTPRVRYGLSAGDSADLPNSHVRHNMLHAVREITYGGHATYSFHPGTYIGVTAYESLYDRKLDYQDGTIEASDEQDRFLNDFGNSVDPEIAASYESSARSHLWNAARASRSVWGLEFSHTFGNFVVQGERGWLTIPDSVYFVQSPLTGFPTRVVKKKADPAATVLLAYTQFRSFNILLLWRDYELGFDNPYQRSFSNYARFKSTIYEDEFYLADDIYSELWSTSYQPQAERGLYTNIRYQISEKVLTGFEYDTWTRVADNARYYRWVTRLEYRPFYNFRIQARNKFQSRGYNPLSPTGFLNRETILTMIFRLSRFDEVSLMYYNGFTEFTSRPRLSDAVGGDGIATDDYDTPRGNAGSPGDMIGLQLTHYFSSGFKVIGSYKIYKGFFWTFEDTDFRVFNSPRTANRYWIAAFARVNRNLALRLKYSFDHQEALTGVQNGRIPLYGEGQDHRPAPGYDAPYVVRTTSDIRFQLDYSF